MVGRNYFIWCNLNNRSSILRIQTTIHSIKKLRKAEEVTMDELFKDIKKRR